MFRLIDIAQALYSIQKFAFDLSATFDIFKDDHLLSASSKAQCMFFYDCKGLLLSLFPYLPNSPVLVWLIPISTMTRIPKWVEH